MKPVCALTGGHGYVGSAIRRALESAGWEVLLLVRNPAPDENAIAWELGSEKSVAGDLAARGAQALIHAAWDLGIVKAADYERVNRAGSKRLFENAGTAGIRNPLFISTISAFDSAVSLYGKTKLAVERDAAGLGGISIRPGLVWGDRPGGVFGAMTETVRKSAAVPLIGSGLYPQYLIHEDDLGRAVERLLHAGDVLQIPSPLTLANPKMWHFRDLVLACARRENKSARLIQVPWRAVWLGLKTAETLGLRLNFRSDSVLSLVNQNPAPDFSGVERAGVVLRPFEG